MVATRGGKRPNAGRKSNAEIAEVRLLIDEAITRAHWKKLFARCATIAEKSKNERAAVFALELLCKYRFGIPVQLVAGDPEGEPIRIVEVRGG